MDPSVYTVRPFAEADYEAVAQLNAILQPRFPETAEDARRWYELTTRDPRRVMLRWVVEQSPSATVVGCGILTHLLWSFHPDKYFVRVAVDPAHRGHGIAHAVYELLENEALARHAICLWSNVRDSEPESFRFLERRGFVPQRSRWVSRLDLTHLDLSNFPDRAKALAEGGIRFTTIAAEGAERSEVRRRLYELSRVSSADTPRMGDYTPASFDEFVTVDLEGPNVLPDAIFLACRADEYVGWSSLQRIQKLPDTLDIGFTGTLPEYRGRGIASELKRRAVEYARARGYHFVLTNNDTLNPRIWAINERLGFRKEETYIEAEKSLVPTRPVT